MKSLARGQEEKDYTIVNGGRAMIFGRRGTYATLTMLTAVSIAAAMLLVALLAAGPAMAQAGPVTNIDTGESFTTIQAAIDDADTQNGHTIEVDPGTYAESVNVDKTLTLEGAQAGVDARDASRGSDESVVTGNGNNGETPFTVAADGVIIEGFTVEGATNANVFGAGVYLSPGTSGTGFLNNIVQDNIVGLFLSNDSTTDQTVIQQNLFRENNQTGPANGNAIYTDQFVAGGDLSNVLI